jgi:hypothetical protein
MSWPVIVRLRKEESLKIEGKRGDILRDFL